ncbi:MAG: hypothetical protein JST82_11350 [Bacteroidetes bacterium]|nr:hypothetical protein [Bacteroidota bacterium]
MAWDSGAYSFFHLSIYLFDGATIDTLKKDKESATCFVTLVHEYIHFIQNFTTLLGFTNFITYVDFFAVFFGNNITLDKDPDIPTKNGFADTKSGSKSYENFIISAYLGIERDNNQRIIFQTTSLANYYITHKTITDPYWQKEVFISYIALDGELIPLNELVAKENMAIVASYKASGLDNEEAKGSIDKLWGKEYHAIYSYINSLFPDKDTLKLTYYFCEMSLLVPPCNKTLHTILEYLRSQQQNLISKTEDEIINNVKHHINFDRALAITLKIANQQLESRIATFSKYEQQYQFYIYLKDVLELFRLGFQERAKSVFTYHEQFDSSFLNHYSAIIKSPVLIFSDKKKTMLGEQTEDFVNSIAYFSGVLSVFHHTYFKELKQCLFADDNSLCSHKKGQECQNSALDIYGNKQYEGCLLYNSLNIIGLKKAERV